MHTRKIDTRWLLLAGMMMATMVTGFCQQHNPWTAAQLLEPADLAAAIKEGDTAKPIIVCVGPGAVIPGSVDIGPTGEKANLNEFRKYLKGLPADASLVIYCGCCPFSKCPNVRPAFSLLNEMGFRHHKLLNVEHNIKADWIDKGYPVAK